LHRCIDVASILFNDVKVCYVIHMFFHHYYKAKFIGALNDKLSLQQKEYIAGTPFWRYKSHVTRTPFSVYGNKKLKLLTLG